MFKKLLYCSALIALGSAAATKKNGALVAEFKNEQVPVFLQASQDVQEVQEAQEISDGLIEQVIFPLVQNLDNLDALEKSGTIENDQDMADLLETLVNLRDSLETLEGVESAVNDAQEPTSLLENKNKFFFWSKSKSGRRYKDSVLLENTQDAKTLTDLISKIVNPLIKNLDGLFGKQTTPVLLEKHNRAGALKQLADWIMGRKSAVLLENNNEFYIRRPKQRKNEQTPSLLENNNKFFFWSKSKSGRRYKNQQASVFLEQAQGVQSLRDLLSKVINPLIDQLSQHLAQQATPALLETENKWFGAQLWKEFTSKRRRKNQETPALVENEFHQRLTFHGRKNQETPALVETEFHPRLRFHGNKNQETPALAENEFHQRLTFHGRKNQETPALAENEFHQRLRFHGNN